MLLVADSGSTKADWILNLSKTESISFRTPGINPFFVNEKDIVTIFQDVHEIRQYFDQVSEIHFFGAGCSSPDRREMVSNALSKVFPNAFVSVEIDLIASIYATCGKEAGLCCILGTGSNITFYDGLEVHDGKHGLGYILGDEGSGTYFGRQLITRFLYGRMPKDLADSFYSQFELTKESVIKRTYQEPAANSFLASFAPFMSTHSDHPYIIGMLKEGFEEFADTNILSYPEYKSHECHFVGSIAYHFSDILRSVCENKGIKTGKILKHPIEELSNFIMEHGIKTYN